MVEETDPVNQMTRAAVAQTVVKQSLPVSPRAESISANTTSEIGIIQGLSPERLILKIEFRLRGYVFDRLINKWTKVRSPVMNELGIGNFLGVLQTIEDNVAFSFYHEKDIPRLVYHAFSSNYPTYIVYAKDFELDAKDFNVIETVLFHYILSVYMAARHGGHRNAVRGTLSENVMAKLFEGKGGGEQKKRGIGGWLNNFWGRKEN